MSRYPRIGDMLIVYPGNRRNDTHPSRRECFAGVVNKIAFDKFGYQEGVFVAWQDQKPDDYDKRYGYAGLNVHNLRREFRIFRDGQEIK